MKYFFFSILFTFTFLMVSCTPKMVQVQPSESADNMFVTPQRFGAKADGKVDDGAALQRAVDFCISNRKKLYIPSGTYRTTRSIKITGQLVMEGEMKDASYIWYDPSGAESLFLIDAGKSSKNLKFSNLKFGLRNFGKGKNNVHCFYVKNSVLSRFNISNVEFFGFTGYGLYLTGKDTYGQNLAFRDLSFYRMGGMIGQNDDRGINNWWTNLVVFENINLDAYSGHSINLQSPQKYIFDMRGWRMVNIRNLLIEGSIKPGANIQASVRLGGGYTKTGSNYLGLGNVIMHGYWEEFSSKNRPAYSCEIVEGVSFIEMKDINAKNFQVNANALTLNIDGIRMHGLNTKSRFEINGNAKVVINNVLNSMDGMVDKKFRSSPNIEIRGVTNKANKN